MNVSFSIDRWKYILTFQGQRRTMLSSDLGVSGLLPCHDVVREERKEARKQGSKADEINRSSRGSSSWAVHRPLKGRGFGPKIRR
jgi:hypothetical protein